jgi:hypothetical protein
VKSVTAPTRVSGQFMQPVTAPLPLRVGEYPHGSGRGGAGRVGSEQNCHPYRAGHLEGKVLHGKAKGTSS